MQILCLRLFLFFQYPYLGRRYKYHQHRGMTQFCLMLVVNYLYIFDPKINPCGTPQFISTAFEKISSGVTKNFFFERHYDANHLMTDS